MNTIRVKKTKQNSRRRSRSNYSLYFYTYLATNLIAVIVNSYLPIYFYNYLNVDKTELAFAQIISYSALFTKPLISVYFDRNPKLNIPIRLVLVGIGAGIALSFIAFIITLPLLLVFGIFLGFNFAFISIIDVIIKKVLIKKSDTEKQKNRNVLYLQAGSLTGAFLPPILRLSLPWDLFFISSFFIVIPLVVVLGFMGAPEYPPDTQRLSMETFTSEFSLKNVVLVCIFTFLIYADQIYQYPLEPYLVSLIGETMFSIFFMGFLLINTFGIMVAGLISHRWDKKKILVYTTTIAGVSLLLTPIIPRLVFVGIYAILMIIGGFMLVNLFSLLIDASQERITIYQIISMFAVMARVILVPLGTGLSAFISPEWIIFLAGVLLLFGLIPLSYITIPSEEKEDGSRTG